LSLTILIADDEPEIHELLTPYLTREGFAVHSVYTGPDTLAAAGRIDPAALLLDVMLPGLDGMEVCRELRRTHTFPILFLSARGEELDKVLGLGLGADDYITKPFSPAEVVARVKAQVRRRRHFDGVGSGLPTPPPAPAPLRVGDLTIDPATATVTRPDGATVELSARELGLLLVLAQAPGRIFTRRQLYEAVWDSPYLGDDNTVMVTIRRLREKVETNPEQPRHIITVRGLGYKLQGRSS
jgi:DNA-binding response OmpR family regulator